MLAQKTVTVIDHAATGSRCKNLRLKKKISLRRLARTMGISAQFLGLLEGGRRSWSDEWFSKWSQAMKEVSK